MDIIYPSSTYSTSVTERKIMHTCMPLNTHVFIYKSALMTFSSAHSCFSFPFTKHFTKATAESRLHLSVQIAAFTPPLNTDNRNLNSCHYWWKWMHAGKNRGFPFFSIIWCLKVTKKNNPTVYYWIVVPLWAKVQPQILKQSSCRLFLIPSSRLKGNPQVKLYWERFKSTLITTTGCTSEAL